MSKESTEEVAGFFDRLAAQLTALSGIVQKLDEKGWPPPPHARQDVVNGQSLDLLRQSMDDLSRLSTEMAASEACVLLASSTRANLLRNLRLEATRSILMENKPKDALAAAGAVEFFTPPGD